MTPGQSSPRPRRPDERLVLPHVVAALGMLLAVTAVTATVIWYAAAPAVGLVLSYVIVAVFFAFGAASALRIWLRPRAHDSAEPADREETP